ncbi:HAMP domain-containing sensor histidine kinase [Dokdonella soli]|uniref:histidine kinase n=1 Tax=Dokdonella soli TaxID=529810 RepID=A0ABN1IDF9_9GAMM
MKGQRSRSLKWRLVGRLVVFETTLMTLFMVLVVGALWGTGYLVDDYEGGTLDVLKEAVARDASGELELRPTRELAQLRANASDLWFVIRDKQGHRLSERSVPKEFAPLLGVLDRISQARLDVNAGRHDRRPDALVKWENSAAGEVQIFGGTQGQMSLGRLITGVSMGYLFVILPLLFLMALAALVVTPLVVRRAMTGLGEAAAQAERIDVDQRGVRLPIEDVPVEVAPLVKAVNDALGRLDEGYERHRRFLVDAAHELRTPIAILTTRLVSLPPGPDKTRLLEDAARLSTLAGQLLDRQRLDQQRHHFLGIDLVAIARRVVADLAPLAFAAGYEMAFDAECGHLEVLGDQTSIERALTNLVQNAIDHGGRCGTIAVRVARAGCIEVSDEGAGIPVEQRERIFEPFRRLRADGRGAGLGLNLVQEIMRLHGGHVAAVDAASRGACLRMVFPPLRNAIA